VAQVRRRRFGQFDFHRDQHTGRWFDEQIHLQAVTGPDVVERRLFTSTEEKLDRLLNAEVLKQMPGHGAVEEMRLVPYSGQVAGQADVDEIELGGLGNSFAQVAIVGGEHMSTNMDQCKFKITVYIYI